MIAIGSFTLLSNNLCSTLINELGEDDATHASLAIVYGRTKAVTNLLAKGVHILVYIVDPFG
ncbi:MAG TPA: hypothetical protein VL854_04595 [Nitrososphaeraceae archaeon]|nr:hypothetical protein [Nitrososphaeraceae archaeon]